MSFGKKRRNLKSRQILYMDSSLGSDARSLATESEEPLAKMAAVVEKDEGFREHLTK